MHVYFVCVTGRFVMKWSKIDFTTEDVVVCENVGTLSVILRRTGALDQSAYVGIHVREMSARIGHDFTPSSAKQVQFSPGTRTALYRRFSFFLVLVPASAPRLHYVLCPFGGYIAFV